MARRASTVILIGLYWDTVFIQSGRKIDGAKAVLMNKRGKVRVPAIPNTVSALRVFRPIEREIPDHASPKKAIVSSISRYPGIPVAGEAPNRYAKKSMIVD